MIPSGVKVFLASHPIDFRKGIDGLLSLAAIHLTVRLTSFEQKGLTGSKLYFGTVPVFVFMRNDLRKRSFFGRRSGIAGFSSTRLS
jgi:hypothetical protein